MKKIVRGILIIFLIWACWIGYQYYTKSPTASILAKEKIEDFFSADLDALLAKTGKGYEYKTVEINGNKFWIKWLFEKRDEFTIEMNGSVDFIELLPFTDFRLGNTFNPTLKLKN